MAAEAATSTSWMPKPSRCRRAVPDDGGIVAGDGEAEGQEVGRALAVVPEVAVEDEGQRRVEQARAGPPDELLGIVGRKPGHRRRRRLRRRRRRRDGPLACPLASLGGGVLLDRLLELSGIDLLSEQQDEMGQERRCEHGTPLRIEQPARRSRGRGHATARHQTSGDGCAGEGRSWARGRGCGAPAFRRRGRAATRERESRATRRASAWRRTSSAGPWTPAPGARGRARRGSVDGFARTRRLDLARRPRRYRPDAPGRRRGPGGERSRRARGTSRAASPQCGPTRAPGRATHDGAATTTAAALVSGRGLCGGADSRPNRVAAGKDASRDK